jgi:hypothetical protein
MAIRVVCAVAVIVAMALVMRVDGADKLSDLQARFDHETNSVHKAKAFEKLGDEWIPGPAIQRS